MALVHHGHRRHDPVPEDTRDPAEALGDHAMGIELQLLEVAHRRDRAWAQHRWDDCHLLDREAAKLQAELAEVGEALARRRGGRRP